MKLIRFLVVLALMSDSLAAKSQTSGKTEDLFAKYPVSHIYKGKPARPRLTTSATRGFRTQIRKSTARGVTFAGHYAVASWGCGAGCTSFAIVDAISGVVYMFPATVSQFNEVGDRLDYRVDSRAIHLIGSLNEEHGADRWYVWNGKQLVMVSEKPARLMYEQPSK